MGWPALGWVIREASKVLVKLRLRREGISHMKNWGKSVGTKRITRAKVRGNNGRGGAGNSPWVPFTASAGHWLSLSWIAFGSYSGSGVHMKILLGLVSVRKLPQAPDTQSSLFYLTFLFSCFGLAPVQPASVTLVTACGFDQELRNCVLVCSKFYFQISVTLFLPLFLSLAPFSIVFCRENKCSVLSFKKSGHVTAEWGSRV